MKTKKEQTEIFDNLKKEVKLGMKEMLISLKNFGKESTGELIFTMFGVVKGAITTNDIITVVYDNNNHKDFGLNFPTYYHLPITNDTLNSQYSDFCNVYKDEFDFVFNAYNVTQSLIHGKQIIKELAHDISALNTALQAATKNKLPERYDIQKNLYQKIKKFNELKQTYEEIESKYPVGSSEIDCAIGGLNENNTINV